MSLGKNIQYLRKQQKVTQEQLAERMSVSRQTISKWEADEVVPELDKLMGLSDMFACKLDTLVRDDLLAYSEIYSEIEIRTVKPFRMAQYVMVTPNPEDDANAYMDRWAERAGLFKVADAKRIGWDFPFVSMEQQARFGLRGYVAAYILPEGFEPSCPEMVNFVEQEEADYAVITIYDPFAAAFERIPNAYKRIMEYLEANGFKEKPNENVLGCFEYVYDKDGSTCMDVYIHVDSVSKAGVFTSFS